MPMTSNMADGINNIDNVDTNPYPNNAISPVGGSTGPVINDANNGNPFPNPNNGPLAYNNQPLEESTSLNSGIAPNTNNISAVGGTLTYNNQPHEKSKSLNGITPTGTPGANTNQVLGKESILSPENTGINTGQSKQSHEQLRPHLSKQRKYTAVKA